MKRHRKLILAASSGLSLFLLLAAWAWIMPPKAAPDDGFHLITTWCAWGDSQFCTKEPGGTVRVPEQLVGLNCRNFDFTTPDTQCKWTPPFQHESTDQVRSATGYNWPLFYLTQRFFVGEDISQSTLLMRLFNASIASLLFALALYVSSPYIRRGLALAWLVAVSPLVAFTMVSTAPQSWAVIGGSLSWVFFAAFLKTDLRDKWRLVITTGAMFVTVAMAVSSRSDTAIYIGVSYLAVLLLCSKDLGRLGRRLALISIPLIILLAFGLLPRGSTFGALAVEQVPSVHELDVSVLLTAMLAGLPGFFAGFTGFFPASQTPWNGLLSYGLGWEGFPSPSFAFIPLLMALGGLAFWGLHHISRNRLLALGLMVSVLLVIPIATVFSFGFLTGVQLRYFLPLMLIVLVFLFMAEPVAQEGMSRGQIVFIGAATFIGGTVAFTSALVRYQFGLTELWDIHWARVWVDQSAQAGVGSAATVALAGAVAMFAFTSMSLLQFWDSSKQLKGLTEDTDQVSPRAGT